MIYIDESLVPHAVHNRGFLAGINDASWSAAPVDLFTSVNPIYTDLRRGMIKYRTDLGQPAADPDPGRTDTETRLDRRPRRQRSARVSGLPDGASYDAALAAR